MWETVKSVAFVITTVMIALILQARASPEENLDSSLATPSEQMEQLDFASSMPSHFESFR